ncbi:MAG: MiaB/RimO family radical SAM methylthiotransferase [bacterium]|nr:MiaB/RimO family radical SAM methylthiotransferase [bacterium]
MKTFKIHTLGCKVNQYDTQVIREDYQRKGYKEVIDNSPADLYIINTCTVTSSADKKSRYYIHHAHRENPNAKILVTGCYAQLDAKILDKIPGVTKVSKMKISLPAISDFQDHTRPFLKIQDGCNNSCSYCKVHIVRGRSRSKPINKVIAEAKQLANKGFKEIVLCGVCLGLYGQDLKPKSGLLQVIKILEKIKGIERIRLSSLEAWDITDSLINHLSKSKKLCRHLHIPIQSGSDNILKRMNRQASFSFYAALFKALRNKMPDLAISTDIIVGFPGETDKDFQATTELLRIAEPLKVHIFPFSARPGTKAAKLPGAVNTEIIAGLVEQLRQLSASLATAYQKKFIGGKMAILIEGRAKENPAYWEGHTANYIKVWVKSIKDLKNNLIMVLLRTLKDEIIIGRMVNEQKEKNR